jgi:hypothetical protein
LFGFFKVSVLSQIELSPKKRCSIRNLTKVNFVSSIVINL